jgi:hypothetical protein
LIEKPALRGRFFYAIPHRWDLIPAQARVESGWLAEKAQSYRRKKTGPQAGFESERADYLVAAASAACEAAVEAAAAASAAVEAAAEAAAAASAAGAATVASVAAGVAAASVVAAGASTAAGATGAASSFLLQAARATAIRETISRDFFMIFLNISKVSTASLNNNYR